MARRVNTVYTLLEKILHIVCQDQWTDQGPVHMNLDSSETTSKPIRTQINNLLMRYFCDAKEKEAI